MITIAASEFNAAVSAAMEALAGVAAETQEEADERALANYKLFRDIGVERARVEYPTHFLPRGPVVIQDEDVDARHTFSWLDKFSFKIQRYPACCGALLLHHFDYSMEDAKFNPDLFGELLKAILAVDNVRYMVGLYRNNRRFIVVMVQTKGFKKNKDGSYDPGDDPQKNMQYPKMYEYFSKHAVNTMYMYNNNSENLLHHMEVIIP